MTQAKRLIAGCAATLMLTGCGAPSVDDLVEDPDKLQQVLADCTLLTAKGKDANSEKCRNARRAAERMAGNLVKGLSP